MAEDIYEPSVPHLQGKTIGFNIQNVEPIMVTNVPKLILDKYNKVALCCDLMHINVIGFLNTISRHIIFATGSIIKNIKINNIEYGIKQFHKLYLHRGFKIMRIHADSEFEPPRAEISDTVTSLNCKSKKEHVPDIERFNRIIKESVRSA